MRIRDWSSDVCSSYLFCRFGQPIPRWENRTELRRRVVRAFGNLANGFGGVNQMIRIVTLVELHSIVTLRHCRWDGFDSRHQRWLFITAVVLALIDNRLAIRAQL